MKPLPTYHPHRLLATFKPVPSRRYIDAETGEIVEIFARPLPGRVNRPRRHGFPGLSMSQHRWLGKLIAEFGALAVMALVALVIMEFGK